MRRWQRRASQPFFRTAHHHTLSSPTGRLVQQQNAGLHFSTRRFRFVPGPLAVLYQKRINSIYHPKENDMKKTICFGLLVCCSFFAFAATQPLPRLFPFRSITVPIRYTNAHRPVVLYIPSACSGMVNEALAGEGELAVLVSGKIHNGQLSVQVKVDYKGSAVTTVEGIVYQVKGSTAASETTTMNAEPVDVFVKGYFKLEPKNKASRLFLADIGYITIYPDGSVADHILDPKIDPAYSRPKVHCKEPKG